MTKTAALTKTFSLFAAAMLFAPLAIATLTQGAQILG